MFKLPLDAIKDEYIYKILKKTKWNSKVDFNIDNPAFTFTINLEDNSSNNNVSKIKDILQKKINEFNNQKKENLKSLLSKIITKIPEKKNLSKSLISNLKKINQKLESNSNNSDEYDIINDSESEINTDSESEINTDSESTVEDLEELLNTLN